MSAYIKVVEEKEKAILRKLLVGDGVIFVDKTLADTLAEKLGREIDGEFIDDYDFGGDADIYVDLLYDKKHFAYDHVLKTLNNSKDSDEE